MNKKPFIVEIKPPSKAAKKLAPVVILRKPKLVQTTQKPPKNLGEQYMQSWRLNF